MEGAGNAPCPEVCRQNKFQLKDGYLVLANNQFLALSPTTKYSIVSAKGERIVVTYILLKPKHIASYQHVLLNKKSFPVPAFAYPVRKRLTKKGPHPYEEDTDMKEWIPNWLLLVAHQKYESNMNGIIASVWGNRLALSLYGQLNEMILSKPPYIPYCDNSAVVQLTQELSASKTRTRHLSMRASWLHHLVQHENVSMQFVPTAHQKADILTKGLTAYAHELARQGLRLQICDGL